MLWVSISKPSGPFVVVFPKPKSVPLIYRREKECVTYLAAVDDVSRVPASWSATASSR
jgi:hypothetical protein